MNEDKHQFEKDVPVMVSVGAAVQDVFLSGGVLTPENDDGELEQQFKLGEKYELDNITYSTGGGATNAAVTFARQGLHAVFMGKVGSDPAGRAIVDSLHGEGVDTSLVKQSHEHKTGYSTILLAPSGERAILTFRGASEHFSAEDFDLNRLHGDWLYISSLAGQLDVLGLLVDAAKHKQMKVAICPGKGELARADEFKQILHRCDLIAANKDEISQLVQGETNEQLVRHCSDMAPTVVMTDGPNGVTATDRQVVISAGMYEDVPVIDRSGAGDAFGSGLVASLALGKDLAQAVTFASANSTSVVSQIGAKSGILGADTDLHGMPLSISDF